MKKSQISLLSGILLAASSLVAQPAQALDTGAYTGAVSYGSNPVDGSLTATFTTNALPSVPNAVSGFDVDNEFNANGFVGLNYQPVGAGPLVPPAHNVTAVSCFYSSPLGDLGAAGNPFTIVFQSIDGFYHAGGSTKVANQYLPTFNAGVLFLYTNSATPPVAFGNNDLIQSTFIFTDFGTISMFTPVFKASPNVKPATIQTTTDAKFNFEP